MIVKSTISPLWLADTVQLESAISVLAEIFRGAFSGTTVFFRADDVAVPGNNCRRMLEVFRKYRVPLHLAVTPAWITASRWAVLKEWAGDDDLWCWHQHGWRHVNHQHTGKKSEFGVSRRRADKRADIIKGRMRLESILGDDFHPVFTPPWNRFDSDTAEVLAELGFKAVSRSQSEKKKVPLPAGVRGTPVNVDLHTRSEEDPQEGLDALLDEFRQAVEFGRVGVMLHHQRMNDAAFHFLDKCLEFVAQSPNLKPIHLDMGRVSVGQAIFDNYS